VVSDSAPWIWKVVAKRGRAIDSVTIASAGLQWQGRFKRSGQFWTPQGQPHLGALIETRQNGHWEVLGNH